MFPEDDFIRISAVQHYLFCPRQCGLIHVEDIWQENQLTARGRILHTRVDAGSDETRQSKQFVRSLKICSFKYGIRGQADLVEFRTQNYKKIPFPVEYKAGKPKMDLSDAAQLCAQALCLEEMLGIDVLKGALYYWRLRQRQNVLLDENLRSETIRIIYAIHKMIQEQKIPNAKYFPKCKKCSLIQFCLPKTQHQKRVGSYLKGLYRK